MHAILSSCSLLYAKHTCAYAGPQRQLPRHPHIDFFTPFPNPTESEDVAKLTLAQQFVDEELQSE
jgi:hypothetical protein